MPKIVLIGAGSVTFTKNLLSDLLSYADLKDVTIALHDIDETRLATADAMARWMVQQLGSTAKIESHASRRPALEGANYVINEIAVGGRASAQIDFDVPRSFGVRQTIADTLGIGGIFRGLRTIPVVVAIGNEMAQLCPDAYLLNYTNPMTMVPRAVYEATPHQKVVGLCHSVRDTESRLARLVGVARSECAMMTAGVNHQAWVLRFEKSGENLYPALDQVIASSPELQRTVRMEMYRALGYFPTESSEHSSEYVPWFLPHDSEVEHFRIPIDEYLRWMDGYAQVYADTRQRLATGRGVAIEPTSELASEVIHSIETGAPRLIYGNVRNGGLIENLPADACVEVPCIVDRAGVRPTRVGALPPQLAALNRNFLNVSELTLRAALEGRSEYVLHAAMLDPHLAAELSLRQIEDLVNTMIEAHADTMPPGIRRARRPAGASQHIPLWTADLADEARTETDKLRDVRLLDWQPTSQLHVVEHPVLQPRFPVIDAHSHIGRWFSPRGEWLQPNVPDLLSVMDANRVHALVNLDGRWGDELEANLDRYDRAHSDRFATFCHLDWSELLTPGFTERLISSVQRSVAAGAKGLKVWKDLGLHHRDDRGELVLLDDPRLEDVWAAVEELGIPVAVHSADPVAFFDPVDEHNERLEQLIENPQWSFADPSFPRFQRLIEALEAVVARHPRTRFVGVHVGCYSENLAWVTRMLDSYENFYIDISARIAELGRQPRASRALMLSHPGRVLFGMDAFPVSTELYRLHFRFLETPDENFEHDVSATSLMGRWRISGLDLPDEVLSQIYFKTAAKLIPSLAPTAQTDERDSGNGTAADDVAL